MFDIAFSELMIIAVVALIVIGPERLPKVARTVGHLVGRMQRYVNDVKADISREMELDELRKLRATMEDAARSVEQTVTTEVRAVDQGMQELASEFRPESDALQQEAAAVPQATVVPAEPAGPAPSSRGTV